MSTVITVDGISDEETCQNCGFTGEPIDYKQRVDQTDAVETIPVLARCSECGYPL
jgi:hypothetical protein